MNVPHNALLQNNIINSAPLNRGAAKAPDKKSFLNNWFKFQNNFTE